jgi:hypothetical protein
MSVIVLPWPAQAETVYEFVVHCRRDMLGDCFGRISKRLNDLNSRARRRICLPHSYGGIMLEDGVIPVSLLEHVRIQLSAAEFGEAGANVDDVLVEVINAIYPCG